MQPIGPLMHEHRLIERMVALITKQAEAIQRGVEPDPEFIGGAVEFFRVYADRCHHGKEEELLFKELGNKNLSPELSEVMRELIQEHKQGRIMVGSLNKANQNHVMQGAGHDEVVRLLTELASFYPKHIEKEDKHFFFPVMDYFTREEMDRMLKEFEEFDQQMIHSLFRKKVESWEVAS